MVSWFVVIQALWAFLPALLANMAPVFAAKILPKWDKPIDAGRVHADGERMLGGSKTWRGLAAGAVVGAAAALAQALVVWDPRLTDFALADTGNVAAALILGTALGLGAGIGDAVKSYFKRRTGRKGGAPWIPFDQLDFVVAGLFFAMTAASILEILGSRTNWFLDTFIEGDAWWLLVVLFVLTPVLHVTVNAIGFLLKLKKVPW